MIIKCLLTVTLFLTLARAATEEEVDYYEELIKETIEATNSYQAPTSFEEEFQLDDEDAEPIDFGAYDFIIVGGGTAGSLLARRLSEVESWNVLVIEGGGRGNNFTDIPALGRYSASSDYNWGFTSTAQQTQCPVDGISDRELNLPRGKGLGGTTLINGNAFARGFPSDYDEWGSLGLPSWSFENVLPYLKKFENASALSGIVTDYHGFDGPLVVENFKNTSDLTEAFVASLNSFGYPLVDYNGPTPIGGGYLQKSTRNGRRNSGDNAFIRPIEDARSNLVLQTNSFVTKILINGNTTTGVEFINGNKKYRANATVEVILSAGTFQSPHILMLSGIGPSSELSEHNISVVLDLPVGQNFRDQYSTAISSTTNVTQNLTAREVIEQYLNTVGPLTTSNSMEMITFVNTSYSTVEYIVRVTNSISLENGSLTVDASKSTTFSTFVMLLHPKSLGSIRLASADPLKFPLFNPNFLQDEEDVEVIVEAAQFFIQNLESEYFEKFNLSISRDATCSNFTFNSADYWRCVARCTGFPGNHPSGTCRMGVSPASSVVNERLLVHGMTNLRVIDASVIPVNLDGHMYATVYLVAEKAADFIKEDYGVLE